jgi:hypothetical protein
MRKRRRLIAQMPSSVNAPNALLMVRMLRGGISCAAIFHHWPVDTPEQAQQHQHQFRADIAEAGRTALGAVLLLHLALRAPETREAHGGAEFMGGSRRGLARVI